jgi:hypothetical protein
MPRRTAPFVRFVRRAVGNRTLWAIATLVLGVAFYLLATSNGVYEATSPRHLGQRLFGEEAVSVGRPLGVSLHVLLRKAYSIIAFGLLALCLQLALGGRHHAITRNAVVLALYSALIEAGQYDHGVREGLASNAVDVACGAAGGWLGTVAAVRWAAPVADGRGSPG